MGLLMQIITIVFPVFLSIALGCGLRWRGFLDDDFLFGLNRLVFYVALPSLLFHKVSSADFSQSFSGMLLVVLFIGIVIIFSVSYGCARVLRYADRQIGSFVQCSFRSNIAYIGLALVYNAYGDQGLAVAGIITGFLVPAVNVFSVIALVLPHKDGGLKNSRLFVRQLVGNPLIIACLLGVVWSLVGLAKPLLLDKTLDIVSGMALPLALLSIGASFSLRRFASDFKMVCVAALFKIVVMPVVVVMLLKMCDVHGMDLGIGFLLAGAPTAAAAFVMSQQMDSDAELAGAIIMVTTLLSLLTYTVGLFFLYSV